MARALMGLLTVLLSAYHGTKKTRGCTMRCSHSRYPRISKPRTSALKDGPLRALPTEMATDWLTTWNGSSAPIRPIPIPMAMACSMDGKSMA